MGKKIKSKMSKNWKWSWLKTDFNFRHKNLIFHHETRIFSHHPPFKVSNFSSNPFFLQFSTIISPHPSVTECTVSRKTLIEKTSRFPKSTTSKTMKSIWNTIFYLFLFIHPSPLNNTPTLSSIFLFRFVGDE